MSMRGEVLSLGENSAIMPLPSMCKAHSWIPTAVKQVGKCGSKWLN